jgi:hypothetical protein
MGFSLLAAIEPSGAITGFCFGSASTADQPLAETFFAVRATPHPRLTSVGSAFSGIYVTDKGVEGGAAQLLYLAQRPARPTSAEVRRSDGMVISQTTPSV